MATTTANQTIRPETMPEKIKRAALSRWKIETLTGLLGLESLEKQAEMSHKNQEAENRWARQHVWGQQPSASEATDESESQDMTRGHILGDVTYPTPIVVTHPPAQAEKSSLLPALALAAATMIPTTGAAAGIIGYLMAQPKPPAQVQPVQPQEYEEFNLGLGRLEDYKPAK